jgi:hypothetical protein
MAGTDMIMPLRVLVNRAVLIVMRRHCHEFLQFSCIPILHWATDLQTEV